MNSRARVNSTVGWLPNMTKVLLAATISLLANAAFAQTNRPPRFSDYPVAQTFQGKASHINFHTCSLARMFRTKLTDAVSLGPNFAGHYGINYWGCGTECIQIGIVDLKTGNVYMPGFAAQAGIDTRVNSRLLIVNPPSRLKELYGNGPLPADYFQTRYYLWRKGTLVLIYPTALKGQMRDILKSCVRK